MPCWLKKFFIFNYQPVKLDYGKKEGEKKAEMFPHSGNEFPIIGKILYSFGHPRWDKGAFGGVQGGV